MIGDYDPDDYSGSYGDGDSDDDGKPKDQDGDTDRIGGNRQDSSYYDGDDGSVRHFGQSAATSDRLAITELVERYYTVAAAQDGATACSMILPSLASSVPKDFGRPPSPSYLRGNTCETVMSKIFKQNIRQVSLYAKSLKVSSVRVDNDRGLAVLTFSKLPARQIHVVRQRSGWKLETLLDTELP
jgi:hypothetical protein